MENARAMPMRADSKEMVHHKIIVYSFHIYFFEFGMDKEMYESLDVIPKVPL